MKAKWIVLLAAIILSPLTLLAAVGKEPDKTNQDVVAVLEMQAQAWNKGDLDKFMTGYLQSGDTSYSSGGVEVWGYEQLKERYEKKYGASKETMGKLSFADLKVFDLGGSGALCIGHWHLDPPAGAAAIDGVFSLTLVKRNGEWKILHDHTSVTPPKG